jgi:hypothetical protein
LLVEQLERRICLSLTPALSAAAIPLPVDPNVSQTGNLADVGATDLYQITVDSDGIFKAVASPDGFETEMSLLDGTGQMLIQSEAASAESTNNQVAIHLVAGTYYLMLEDAQGQGSYSLSTSFSASIAPDVPLPGKAGAYSVAVANLMSNGIPDLVVADLYADEVLVYMGNGDGTYQPPIALAVGEDPVFVTTADLTGNGLQDIITANVGSNDVSVLLNEGGGRFQPAIETPAGPGPTSVAVGDFNGDGDLDLAVTDSYAADVQILLGNGNGAFAQGEMVPTDPAPWSVAAADFNGDGITDLAVVAIGSSSLEILDGNGDGTFTQAQELSTGPTCLSVVAANFNSGGLPDIAVACAHDNSVEIFSNTDGTFQQPTVIPSVNDPFTLVAADFTGNGNIDLAVSSYGVGGVSLLMGDGNGNFVQGANISLGPSTTGLAAADLTGDGRMDLVATDLIDQQVDVLLGNGDGTFQVPQQPAATTTPTSVVAADLTNNGILDLIVPDESMNEISVLLGRGDGTFRAPILIPVGLGPTDVVVGDFNGDGIPDIAVANRINDSISILLGEGNGYFTNDGVVWPDIQPTYITAADLTGNGILDLVVSNFYSDTLSIFYGNGDGTFQTEVDLPTGNFPGKPVIADFNGDGRLDIAVPDGGDQVTLFLATGPESYAAPVSYTVGSGAVAIAAGDLSDDGIIDLVVALANPAGQGSVAILWGNGDGTFRLGATIPVGLDPSAVALADLNDDGKLDVIVADQDDNDLTILPGLGNGEFGPSVTLAAGPGPAALSVADLNGEGRLDILVADYDSSDVTMLENLGALSFALPATISTVGEEVAMVTAQFTDDERLDVAVADPLTNTVQIMLGNGDGGFTAGEVLEVGVDPSGLVAADFNGDGRPDLAVANATSDNVMIFLGLGDGTFASPIVIPVGIAPHAIVAGDFFHTGVTEFAVADEISNDVTVWTGFGHGSATHTVVYKVGDEPVALVAADLSGDGLLDLVTANRSSGDLTILWASTAGTFSTQTISGFGTAPVSLAAGDFAGNGRTALAVGDENLDRVTIIDSLSWAGYQTVETFNVGESPSFLATSLIPGLGVPVALTVASDASSAGVVIYSTGNGPLSFQYTVSFAGQPVGYVQGYFNGPGIPDDAYILAAGGAIEVGLPNGAGGLLPPPQTAPLPQASPIAVDWSGDGTTDVFTLDEEGQLLLRLGQPGSPGQFEAPEILGQYLGATFCDIALVKSAHGYILAALAQGQSTIWLFSTGQGPGNLIQAEPITVPDAGLLVSLSAGDLDGSGLDDLVVVDRGNDQLIVLYQNPNGSFVENGPRLDVGSAPSTVAIANLTGGALPDLIVTNTDSGDVSVFQCLPGRHFGPELRLAAGLSAATVVSTGGTLSRYSSDQPMGVTAGIFDSSGLLDVVAVDSGTDQISILDGTAGGQLADPSLATTYSTGIDPTQVVAASLTGNGLTDLVVLNQGSDNISIFLNNGKGGFTPMPIVDAGNDPTGLAVCDINGSGIPDLLVSNSQGDLLIILGNGDGTFKPYERADPTVSLAVGDFNSEGQPEYVLSNTSIDQLSILYGDTESFVQGREQGLEAPGAVAVADLNGDGNPDLIVVNQGENDILVYLGLGGNHFAAPLRFFTGTDPQGITVADLTGNGDPDIIVANAGSNDLSLFIGVGTVASWQLITGPRLRVGEEPVSTTVVTGPDGVPDIIAVDEGSNNVMVLEGVGGGYFNDTDPLLLPTGQSPIQAFVGNFDSARGQGLAVLDEGGNNLTYYSNFLSGDPVAQFIPTGGVDPVAAAVGYFAGNSYSDIVVANSGDDRITLLEGSAQGLILATSEFLNQSLRPSDLIVSGDAGGDLRLAVSAQGQDSIFSVTLSVGLVSSSAASQSSSQSSQSAQVVEGQPNLSTSSASNVFTTELFSASAGPQVQASATLATASASSAAALGPPALGMAVLTTIDPLLNISSSPIPGAISNLVRIGQVQISDLLPLEQSGMETIAVLLVVSATSVMDPTVAGTDLNPIPAIPPGSDLEATRSRPVSLARLADTSLDHYLADFDGALDALAHETSESIRQSEFEPTDLAIAIKTSGPIAPRQLASTELEPSSTVPGQGEVRATHSSAVAILDAALAELERRESELDRPASGDLPAIESGSWLQPVGTLAAVSGVVLAWMTLRSRRRLSAWAGHTANRQSVPKPHLSERPGNTRSLRSRVSREQELPPWLTGRI